MFMVLISFWEEPLVFGTGIGSGYKWAFMTWDSGTLFFFITFLRSCGFLLHLAGSCAGKFFMTLFFRFDTGRTRFSAGRMRGIYRIRSSIDGVCMCRLNGEYPILALISNCQTSLLVVCVHGGMCWCAARVFSKVTSASCASL